MCALGNFFGPFRSCSSSDSPLSSSSHKRKCLKNYRDWISVIETAENKGVAKGHAKGLEEGIAKGRELGEKEKAIAIARQLKGMNIDVEVISRSTGLDIKEIERI